MQRGERGVAPRSSRGRLLSRGGDGAGAGGGAAFGYSASGPRTRSPTQWPSHQSTGVDVDAVDHHAEVQVVAGGEPGIARLADGITARDLARPP